MRPPSSGGHRSSHHLRPGRSRACDRVKAASNAGGGETNEAFLKLRSTQRVMGKPFNHPLPKAGLPDLASCAFMRFVEGTRPV
jgi:hypothetical protein